jgi:hypothetical protein
MILPITRILLLSTILGGFAVSASFAQGTPGGQGQGQGGQSPSGQSQQGMQGGAGAGGGQVVPPPGTPPSGTSKQDHKQHNMQDQQGQSGGQGMDRRKHRGEGDQAGRRDGGRGGEMDRNRGRHENRHRRDARFRYYHGGFWYAEPWWTVVVVGNDRHVRWCRRHYPNYRAGSNSFITPSGRRRVCISPFG